MCKELRDYLDRDGVLGVRVAESAGLTSAFLIQIANGQRPAPATRCASIEVATGGAVRRWDLRPDDWHRIWPELIGTPGAPPMQREIHGVA